MRLVDHVDGGGELPQEADLGAGGIARAGQRERCLGHVGELFGPHDGRDRTHARAMHDQIGVAAAGGGSIEGPASNPFAARLHAITHEPHVDAGKDGASVREDLRLVRAGVDVADADNQGSERALPAHHGIDAGAPARLTHVGGESGAHLEREPWNPGDDIHPMLEKGVRQREVVVVTNERRPQEARVGVVARGGDAERRAVPAGPDPDEELTRLKCPLAVRFDHLNAVGVWICCTKRVAVGPRTVGPRALAHEPNTGCHVPKGADLCGNGRDVVG